ncbi:hypothetical protein AAGW05_08600 [Arthrobacter sp. LAPM80]|uniref:hypothetical protein n=1 Tax=Arthrobacter sp. LAPM80 TaxID=3141788 RepID=UPI00398B15AB
MEQCNGAGSDGPEADIRRQFREMTESFMVPYRNECMICFLMRAMPLLETSGFAMTAAYRKFNAPRATNLGRRLSEMGIFGDCQLLQRGVVVNDAIWEADRCPDCGIPVEVPDCLEVRLGSTQPCKLWRWRRDVEREQFDAWLAPNY